MASFVGNLLAGMTTDSIPNSPGSVEPTPAKQMATNYSKSPATGMLTSSSKKTLQLKGELVGWHMHRSDRLA